MTISPLILARHLLRSGEITCSDVEHQARGAGARDTDHHAVPCFLLLLIENGVTVVRDAFEDASLARAAGAFGAGVQHFDAGVLDELSPREDFTPFFLHPRANKDRVIRFKAALDAAAVKIASHLPLYRWSGPDEQERQAAVRYYGKSAVDMIRGINSPNVSFLYCAPHTFHMGGNMVEIMEYAGDLLTHLHIADSFDHTASSGLRYIVNPPGSAARVHQHLDIGQGEVNWDDFFATLSRMGFDGIATVCVFAWEDRARESCFGNREKLQQYLDKHF